MGPFRGALPHIIVLDNVGYVWICSMLYVTDSLYDYIYIYMYDYIYMIIYIYYIVIYPTSHGIHYTIRSSKSNIGLLIFGNGAAFWRRWYTPQTATEEGNMMVNQKYTAYFTYFSNSLLIIIFSLKLHIFLGTVWYCSLVPDNPFWVAGAQVKLPTLSPTLTRSLGKFDLSQFWVNLG